MQDEMNHLLKDHTWYFVTHPQGKDIVKCPWVYKTKFTSKGVVECHKSRLVAKGFSQQEGINYNETFVPVTPPCLGVIRGDHVSWYTMKIVIPTIMMINILSNFYPYLTISILEPVTIY